MNESTRKKIEEAAEKSLSEYHIRHANSSITITSLYTNAFLDGHALGKDDGKSERIQEVLALLRSDEAIGVIPNKYDIRHISTFIEYRFTSKQDEPKEGEK